MEHIIYKKGACRNGKPLSNCLSKRLLNRNRLLHKYLDTIDDVNTLLAQALQAATTNETTVECVDVASASNLLEGLLDVVTLIGNDVAYRQLAVEGLITAYDVSR